MPPAKTTRVKVGKLVAPNPCREIATRGRIGAGRDDGVVTVRLEPVQSGSRSGPFPAIPTTVKVWTALRRWKISTGVDQTWTTFELAWVLTGDPVIRRAARC
jgi:hypothetical protein